MTTSIPNLRDVGGMPAAHGRSIAPGRVLRSGLPFDDDEVRDLAWPPSLVIDLRAPEELKQHPALSGPRTVNVPLLASLAPDPQLDGTLVVLYRSVLSKAAPLLVDIVREVAAADGPVLLHCSAGKDRTGIAVALLLRLAGVEREVIMADYARTDDHLDAIDARLRGLPGNEHRDRLPREYFHVVPAALDAVLDEWDGAAGGVAGWLVAAGADPDLADRLRDALLIDAPS